MSPAWVAHWRVRLNWRIFFFLAVQCVCLFAVQCSILLLTAFYFPFFLQSHVYLQYNEDHDIRYCIENSTYLIRSIFRGESRIPRKRGTDPRGGGGGAGQNTILPNFPKKKLHEIEKILGRRGARAGGPPLDPPLILNIKDPSNNLPVQQNTCW